VLNGQTVFLNSAVSTIPPLSQVLLLSVLLFTPYLLIERYITAETKWEGARESADSVTVSIYSLGHTGKRIYNSHNNFLPKSAIIMSDLNSDESAVKHLISRLKRFEPINLTAMLIDGYDDDPQRQQHLEYRARIILETAMKWFPKPALVRANIDMQMFENRAKAFAAVCNFLADSPVVLDEVVRDREEAAAVEGEEEEWEGCSSDDGDEQDDNRTTLV
jgi:hypothetical protein